MQTENDEKKITVNDAEKTKRLIELQVFKKIWLKKKKVMQLVKLVN